MLPDLKDYIGKLMGIREERKDENCTDSSQSHMDGMIDLQAAVEADIGFSGMDALSYAFQALLRNHERNYVYIGSRIIALAQCQMHANFAARMRSTPSRVPPRRAQA